MQLNVSRICKLAVVIKWFRLYGKYIDLFLLKKGLVVVWLLQSAVQSKPDRCLQLCKE